MLKNNDLFINHTVTIPYNELEITSSKASGPGGQHVNKTASRITVRWNIHTSAALTQEQKERILEKLHTRITDDGYLIIHNSESRSQQQNKKNALTNLALIIRNALFVAKKRIATTIPQGITQQRLKNKTERSVTKKMRRKPTLNDD